ncbi:MAG: hypothetical protein CL463_03825, partial [Acidimicrobiaceae bacterium]|nr:hypothetical protein [Acidimicrobiaceae bacterium]
LEEILKEARKYKFLGPLPLEDHVKNGKGFIEMLGRLSPDIESPHWLVDLGSGGGVPAFVIAEKFPHWQFFLVERKKKRAEFLTWAVENVRFGTNIHIVHSEAETAARDKQFEKKADFVTARSFATPSKTAECGCRFLKEGGFMIVSEPPKTGDRWSEAGLSLLGLRTKKTNNPTFGTFQVLELEHFPDKRYPRRPGAIKKKALW